MSVSILITGPTRSGKSEFAERLIRQHNHDVVYIATAFQNRNDYEWQARIAKHRDRRPSTWKTLESPRDLVGSIRACNNQVVPPCVLIDSFGTWVANWLEDDIAAWKNECDDLISEITIYQGSIICVAEETGWGIVPAYPTGRLFRDRLGHLTRRTATIVDQAYLVVAGYAIDLKHVGIAINP
ncbi:MAG: bifunctional adenosylcobinamide kinase/adenosylcobinamide-phosphate guanylyltransferase [Coleofasciculaceae cyanobacterium RL_1_1]|nr:bifunctional adenosylcobinamide kinase/adenosylcobinamide-phosphate guanylyltransferase [Coleofasciculaceae cyanobacterium RL_1_1]